MDYKVIVGFYDTIEKRGYRLGDTFVVGKTSKERLAQLASYDNTLGTPLIALAKDLKVENPPKQEEELKDVDLPTGDVTYEELEVLSFEQLKEYADGINFAYAPNIGHETLLKKFKESEEN